MPRNISADSETSDYPDPLQRWLCYIEKLFANIFTFKESQESLWRILNPLLDIFSVLKFAFLTLRRNALDNEFVPIDLTIQWLANDFQNVREKLPKNSGDKLAWPDSDPWSSVSPANPATNPSPWLCRCERSDRHCG